jgi:hypothetical protein
MHIDTIKFTFTTKQMIELLLRLHYWFKLESSTYSDINAPDVNVTVTPNIIYKGEDETVAPTAINVSNTSQIESNPLGLAYEMNIGFKGDIDPPEVKIENDDIIRNQVKSSAFRNEDAYKYKKLAWRRHKLFYWTSLMTQLIACALATCTGTLGEMLGYSIGIIVGCASALLIVIERFLGWSLLSQKYAVLAHQFRKFEHVPEESPEFIRLKEEYQMASVPSDYSP